MRLFLLLAATAVMLSGCKKEVSREVMGLPDITEEMTECPISGVCFKCDVNFDLELDCGVKISSSCPGQQKSVVTKTPMRVYYNDDTHRDYVETEIQPLEACKEL